MIKHFCDACGKEVERSFVADRFKAERHMGGKKFEIEVMVAVNGTWNAGDLCELCLRKVMEAPQRAR